ncbi:class I SAM-dependent methyltransferase [Coleofasciculus sp. G2-EDA-02]|uniref:class I SAM-dependent methyltransferase n=1 Tax=Coleofasciculus sp. G2-EDA-02 TaxID=3069529 RepID=UPI0032FAE54E
MQLSFFNTDENRRWHEIRGWLLPIAAEELYRFACEASADGMVVEIGSFAGKSTVCITRALASKSDSPAMTAIDINFQPDFAANLEQFDVSHLVNTISAPSLEAAEIWNEPISFLYIDGRHSKAHAYADFVVWESMVLPEGIVALDDTAGLMLGPSLQLQAALRTGAYELLADAGGISFLRKKRSLVSGIGDFPLREGSLMSLVAYVSAWSGAMDLGLRIPHLGRQPLKREFSKPKPRQTLKKLLRGMTNLKTPESSSSESRTKKLEKPLAYLERMEAIKELEAGTTNTLLYLRACIEMQRECVDAAIKKLIQLRDLDYPSTLIHYQIDVRQMAWLRLAQCYDLEGQKDLAKATYQHLLDTTSILPEITHQAKLGLSEPFQLPAQSPGLLLREYIIDSPLAKYRAYYAKK